MIITPLVGTSREVLLRRLTEIENALGNVRSTSTAPDGVFKSYLRWAADAVRALGPHIREADLNALILTRRYWSLQAMATGPIGSAYDLVEVEIDDRGAALAASTQATREEFERWDKLGRLVVADTSFFHQHPQTLDQVDLSKLIHSRHAPIGLVIPIVVIDELEKQKRSSDRHVRGRAQLSLAVIERVIRHGGPGQLRPADFSAIREGGIPSGEHSIDVLFDVRGHSRLPIVDDEIIDRALSVQLMSGKIVSFITYDTNQALRARHEGLTDVLHLRHEQEQPKT